MMGNKYPPRDGHLIKVWTPETSMDKADAWDACAAARAAERDKAAAARAEMLDALIEGEIWLRSALGCKAFHWDVDQHIAATSSLEKMRAAIAKAGGR